MQPIFSSNSDINKTAFLNWRTIKNEEIFNMAVIGEGFLSASIQLAKQALANNKNKEADILIFAILHNANHGIEVYLKALLWTLNKLLGSDRKIEGKHNIKQILQTVQSKIEKYLDKDALNYFNETNEDLIEYINELSDKIQSTPKKDNMDFTRYPIDVDYNNHFYVDELENVKVDLENFISRFAKIKSSIDNAFSYFFFQHLNEE